MKKKILLIHGNENFREILQMYLELKNYEVYQSSNGIEGLEEAKQILPDLILLDVMLPGINGYQTCQLLKKDEQIKDIPVLFISSLLETSEKIKGLESGAVDFINDLADYAEILARIETHLKIKDLTDELQATNQELRVKQKLLQDDLHAASIIQQSLLPVGLPPLPNIEISWLCEPCEAIGGDICSISKLNEESSLFYMLDVSGHGVSSAMVTVSITQYLQQKQLLNRILSPKQVLINLNHDYPFEKFNIFSTIFYMIFNTKTGKLTYSSAGHPPAVLLTSSQPYRLLSTAGALIGVTQNFDYEEKEEYLNHGDKIILYTDGVTEFRNFQGELYGSERFYDLLEKIKYYPVRDIVSCIEKSLKEFGMGRAAQDDISILGIEFKPLSEG